MTMLDPDDLSPGEIIFSSDDSTADKSFLAEFFNKKQSFLGSKTRVADLQKGRCLFLVQFVVKFDARYLTCSQRSLEMKKNKINVFFCCFNEGKWKFKTKNVETIEFVTSFSNG
uniref:Uncharacterized protein n=1 Tax=Caenorhabditis japonica TaxID=281687 RepID=A0A8R1IDI4_CAEJA